MKIYLLDRNEKMITQWALAFGLEEDVEVCRGDFVDFMKTHPDVDCIVSPGNAFGKMTGGYDAAISDYLGWDFQKKVQNYIRKHFEGEQFVGTSFIIDTDKPGLRFIHTPTMRVPSVIKDELVIYQCMRSALLTAINEGINAIVVPAFGGGCGEVPEMVIAAMMKKGYKQIMTGKSAYFV